MKIERYFSGIKDANSAVEKLKAEGYLRAISDLNEHYNSTNNTSSNPSGTMNASSISSIVLNSGDSNKGPLLASSPMVSGMGNFEEIADINYKVTVEAEDKEKSHIKEIIIEMGGTLSNPNFQMPKGKEISK